MRSVVYAAHREPWNKGKIVGQKVSFKVRPPEPAIRRDLRCCLAADQTITRPAVRLGKFSSQPRPTLSRSLKRASLWPWGAPDSLAISSRGQGEQLPVPRST
jgi:hypothetical protein